MQRLSLIHGRPTLSNIVPFLSNFVVARAQLWDAQKTWQMKCSSFASLNATTSPSVEPSTTLSLASDHLVAIFGSLPHAPLGALTTRRGAPIGARVLLHKLKSWRTGRSTLFCGMDGSAWLSMPWPLALRLALSGQMIPVFIVLSTYASSWRLTA